METSFWSKCSSNLNIRNCCWKYSKLINLRIGWLSDWMNSCTSNQIYFTLVFNSVWLNSVKAAFSLLQSPHKTATSSDLVSFHLFWADRIHGFTRRSADHNKHSAVSFVPSTLVYWEVSWFSMLLVKWSNSDDAGSVTVTSESYWTSRRHDNMAA